MDTYAFLTELKEHNQREWFLKSKERYEEHFRTPALQFVSAAAPAMAKISQYLVADPRPSGGSLFAFIATFGSAVTRLHTTRRSASRSGIARQGLGFS